MYVSVRFRSMYLHVLSFDHWWWTLQTFFVDSYPANYPYFHNCDGALYGIYIQTILRMKDQSIFRIQWCTGEWSLCFWSKIPSFFKIEALTWWTAIDTVEYDCWNLPAIFLIKWSFNICINIKTPHSWSKALDLKLLFKNHGILHRESTDFFLVLKVHRNSNKWQDFFIAVKSE